MSRLRADRPVVIAHRGASAYAPEHTHAAWERALRMGADYIEQDLQLTSDGVLVVLHDEALDRTARGPGCTGRIIDRTLDGIRACDVGSWFNEAHPALADPAFAAERIATLAEVLDRYADRARFYIETKKPEEAPGMEDALIALLRERGLAGGVPRDGLPIVILQSFSAASLRRLRELAPDIPRVQLMENGSVADAIARLESIAAYADGAGPSRHLVNADFVTAAHAQGLAVHPWTVNETTEMERLLAAGVDGLFTDRPDVLHALR